MPKYQLGLYEKSMPNDLTMEQKLSYAKASGYDFLEMSIDESDTKLARLAWGRDEILLLRYSIEAVDMPIWSICLSGHRRYPLGDPDPAVQRRSLDVMQRAVELASALGVRFVQIAGYDVYYKPHTDKTQYLFEQNLLHSVELAAKHGVVLGFETMETSFMDTVEKAQYWVDKIQSPYLQIYPDCGNVTNAAALYDTSVEEDLEKGRGHIIAMHLKETSPGIYREVPYGTGHVNFSTCVEKSKQLGVRIFTAEFWYTGQEKWQEVLSSNCKFLRYFLN